tara:strand:+ start:1298 stop:2014 length:717 start_codon:yes stop_codon:yes gene_type:complete
MIRTLGAYGSVADEYYNPLLHPTCANFRELSWQFLENLIKAEKYRDLFLDAQALETGAGKSLVAEFFLSKELSIQNLSLQDKSEEMLAHSFRWQNKIEKMFVSDAREMPIPSNEIQTVFSFLADPYNDEIFWSEVSRVLDLGGLWVLTCPSHEWASTFRSKETDKLSRFVLADGREVDLTSLTYPTPQFVNSLREKNLVLECFQGFSIMDIKSAVSQKLISNNPLLSSLNGYVFRKIE